MTIAQGARCTANAGQRHGRYLNESILRVNRIFPVVAAVATLTARESRLTATKKSADQDHIDASACFDAIRGLKIPPRAPWRCVCCGPAGYVGASHPGFGSHYSRPRRGGWACERRSDYWLPGRSTLVRQTWSHRLARRRGLVFIPHGRFDAREESRPEALQEEFRKNARKVASNGPIRLLLSATLAEARIHRLPNKEHDSHAPIYQQTPFRSPP